MVLATAPLSFCNPLHRVEWPSFRQTLAVLPVLVDGKYWSPRVFFAVSHTCICHTLRKFAHIHAFAINVRKFRGRHSARSYTTGEMNTWTRTCSRRAACSFTRASSCSRPAVPQPYSGESSPVFGGTAWRTAVQYLDGILLSIACEISEDDDAVQNKCRTKMPAWYLVPGT